jgi:adenylate cyclase
MSDTKTLQSIADDAKDIFKTQIEWVNFPSDQVPNDNDQSVTFETGKNKKVKKMETAVLYVDLRNSTQINLEQNPEKLVQIYAAFVRAMIQCAEVHGGFARNIVGDRVMVVFPAKDCCDMAIKTALTMHAVVSKILNPLFPLGEIRAGIGVDFGKMYVAKVGLAKTGTEKNPHRNLVWLGKPANFASKLTDHAGKQAGSSKASSILVTQSVLDKYRAANPNEEKSSKNSWTHQLGIKIEGLSSHIFGTDFTLPTISQVKL